MTVGKVDESVRLIDVVFTLLDYVGVLLLCAVMGTLLRSLVEGDKCDVFLLVFFEIGLWFLSLEVEVLKGCIMIFIDVFGVYVFDFDIYEIYFDSCFDDDFLVVKYRVVFDGVYKLLYILI